MLPWVTKFSARLYCGPVPSTTVHLKHLVEDKGINCLVNIAAKNLSLEIEELDYVHLELTHSDYIKHAKLLLKRLTDRKRTIYIFLNTGLLEEAYVTFALWYLITKEKEILPVNPRMWIQENGYEMLFGEQNEDELLVLDGLWKTLTLETQRSSFFTPKKLKSK